MCSVSAERHQPVEPLILAAELSYIACRAFAQNERQQCQKDQGGA
jgi:hypothetical protein